MFFESLCLPGRVRVHPLLPLWLLHRHGRRGGTAPCGEGEGCDRHHREGSYTRRQEGLRAGGAGELQVCRGWGGGGDSVGFPGWAGRGFRDAQLCGQWRVG